MHLHLGHRYILPGLLVLLLPALSHAQGDRPEFVKGLDAFVTYSPATGGDEGVAISSTIHGRTLTSTILPYEGSVLVATQDEDRSRSIVYQKGRLNLKKAANPPYPVIGYEDGREKLSNKYILGWHDFTGDGEPELVLGVQDEGEGEALFVLEYRGGEWIPLGEIVTRGRGLGGGRIFRQAITLKGPDGVLHTWTFRKGRFEYASSDHSSSPRDLY